ncbi:MAG: ATP synthase F1 subunit gamma [Candidatus Aminicenantes bacterium]|nr:ATP synthase F1 subunit gamma [Candidatus Aminicenantes bacterium]
MPALIDLRKRIRSVRNTQQITQAMKTVSTAKFKKAQRNILERRPYWHNMPDMVLDMARWAERKDHPLLMAREEKRLVALIVTSDKGLAGAFNSNLLEKTDEELANRSEKANISLILIGKKAEQFFKHRSYPVLRSYAGQIQNMTEEDLKDLSRYLMKLFVYSETDAVYAAYNEFKSILAPKITFLKLLPLEFSQTAGGMDSLPPDWDPSRVCLLESVLPLYFENQVFHCFYESAAAEQAARMMAMDNATRNADELISDLTLLMNKLRQASITTELLEIMTAVDALAKK